MTERMANPLAGGPDDEADGPASKKSAEPSFRMRQKKTTNQRVREILVETERNKHASKNVWNARRREKAKRVGALYNTNVVEKFVQKRVLHPGTGDDLLEKARVTKFTKSDLDTALQILSAKARQYDPLATHNALKDCLQKELRIDDLHHLLLQSFHLTLPVPQLKALFIHFDADKSGTITYLEFLVKFTRLAISEKDEMKREHNIQQRESTERVEKAEAKRRRRFTQWNHKKLPSRFSIGDLQTALGKVGATPALSTAKLPGLMIQYEMQGLLEPDEFAQQLRTNFHVKLTDYELAALVAVFDPNASGYLEMTEFFRGFQTLRYMKGDKYVRSQAAAQEDEASAWEGGRLKTPAAAGLLNERLGATAPTGRGGGEPAWRPVTREEGNFRRRGLTREGKRMDGSAEQMCAASGASSKQGSGQVSRRSSKPTDWGFAESSQGSTPGRISGKVDFASRTEQIEDALSVLSVTSETTAATDGATTNDPSSRITGKEIIPRLYGKPKGRKTIRPNRQGSTAMLVHTNNVLDLHDPLASLSNGKMSTGAISGHAQEKRTMLLFVAKWSTMGQWIAALENGHFRLEDLRHQLTMRAWEATNRRNHEHAHAHHFAGLKGTVIHKAPKPQPMRRMALSREDFTAFCDESFTPHVWSVKTSARLFSAFDAARQNFIWTTELVCITACIDKINRNRSNARAGGTRGDIQHEDIDIMMDVFRQCARELVILDFLKEYFNRQQFLEGHTTSVKFDETAKDGEDGGKDAARPGSKESTGEEDDFKIPEPAEHVLHQQKVPADMLVCVFSSFSCSDMDTLTWECAFHNAFHAVPPETADHRHPQNVQRSASSGTLPLVGAWNSPSKNSGSPTKSKKPRNQLWTEAGFLRLLRTSPDLVDLFEEKLTMCANRAGRQGGSGLAGSSVVNLKAGAANTKKKG